MEKTFSYIIKLIKKIKNLIHIQINKFLLIIGLFQYRLNKFSVHRLNTMSTAIFLDNLK